MTAAGTANLPASAGKPDPVWGCGGEVARDQARRDRENAATVGVTDPTCRRHERANAIPSHQPFDPATAASTSLRPQDGVDPRTAIALAVVAMDLPDLSRQRGTGGSTGAHRTPEPSAIAGRRDLEHGTHQPHRTGVAVVLNERKLMSGFRQRSRSTSRENSRMGIFSGKDCKTKPSDLARR